MKRHIYFIGFCIFVFLTGYSINSVAMSDTTYRIAVVDVPVLISKDSQIIILKKEQQKNTAEIQKILDKANHAISMESDPVKISQIEEKYRAQINNQKMAFDKEYNAKIKQTDAKVKTIITSKAKKMKYNLVLPKSIVLYGGDDITNEISKFIK